MCTEATFRRSELNQERLKAHIGLEGKGLEGKSKLWYEISITFQTGQVMQYIHGRPSCNDDVLSKSMKHSRGGHQSGQCAIEVRLVSW